MNEPVSTDEAERGFTVEVDHEHGYAEIRSLTHPGIVHRVRLGPSTARAVAARG
ncbi:hypothetical protein AB2L57_04160 [Microbacterium sp. HA-8]|jgi:hypothetical protein|uniref:hypothetical protein n=1 Tax=Microbacterium sp. HA-8 TaxID=3234200 RepID=UPI0038F601D5